MISGQILNQMNCKWSDTPNMHQPRLMRITAGSMLILLITISTLLITISTRLLSFALLYFSPVTSFSSLSFCFSLSLLFSSSGELMFCLIWWFIVTLRSSPTDLWLQRISQLAPLINLSIEVHWQILTVTWSVILLLLGHNFSATTSFWSLQDIYNWRKCCNPAMLRWCQSFENRDINEFKVLLFVPIQISRISQ